MSYEYQKWARLQVIAGSAKAVLVSLSHFVNRDGQCWPSHQTVAFETGLSISSVERAIRKLKKEGFIQVQPRKIRHTNLYIFPRSYPQVNPSHRRVYENKPVKSNDKPVRVTGQTRHPDVLTVMNSHIELSDNKKQEEQKMNNPKDSAENVQGLIDQAFDLDQTEVPRIVQLMREDPNFRIACKCRSDGIRKAFEQQIYGKAEDRLRTIDAYH